MDSRGANNLGSVGVVPALRAGDLRVMCAVLLIGAAVASSSRAESQLQSTLGRGALSASAHLGFRVTVLPSLALSMQAQGAQILGNAGVLTVQYSSGEPVDGAAPTRSTQMRPRHIVVDSALPRGTRGQEFVTLAAP